MHHMVHCPLAVGLMLLILGEMSLTFSWALLKLIRDETSDLPRRLTRAGEGEN